LNKILLVRLGAMGDLIHTLPAAAALRKVYPQARIDWVVDRRHHELLDLVPVIDRRIAVDTGSVPSLLEAVGELRRSRYDAALDLQGLLKSAVLARLSGATRVIGFPAPLLRERLAAWFYTETAGVAAEHVIRKNLSMLKALGIETQQAAVEFPLEDRRPGIVDKARQNLGIQASDRFAIVNPGAAWPNKRWPAVYFAEVAAALKKTHGLPSLVLWGPGEERLARDVVDASNGSAAVSPPTTLADLVSLTKAAAIMVSGDTGPLHVAGAVGTPLVGIFGPTNPERNGPWDVSDAWESRFGSCQCRYQRQCHAKRWCLLDLPPRNVIDLIGQRLHG
jgi:lipopolysaccharide heptosyltransferase I